jgi:prolyl oligopeptidase
MAVKPEVIMVRCRSRFLMVCVACAAWLTSAAAQTSFKYPQPRKADVADTYFGTRVADPYRWMENLNSPELKTWIDEENAITVRHLDRLPSRDALKTRITELWNYPKVSLPHFEGRRWFYSRNTGLQRQSVVFTRETLTGPETIAIDPNELWPDGATALSNYVPSPDGQHLAYGQAKADRTGRRTRSASWRAARSSLT